MEAILIVVLVIVFSAILHEVAHGFVADKLGDPTARLAGRLTLNPIPHIDPIMSIAVPILLYVTSHGMFVFGGAKPVPVNPLMLHEGRKDVALVALAGPLTNLLLALISAGLFLLFSSSNSPIGQIFYVVARFNLLLGFLNLIPIPPLDGSKFFSIALPERAAQQYLSLAPFGIFILFFLLLATPLGDYLQILILNSLHLLGM
jgi:Zn-dependent protease